MTIRLPAEWEKQFGIQLTWPHANSDWKDILAEVEPCFVSIAKEISLTEKLLIVHPHCEEVLAKLEDAEVEMENISFAELETNDTWARDHGAIAVYEDEKTILLDFSFNGWGLKFSANFDNQINHKLHHKGIFKNLEMKTLNFVLEGGSIESDGAGTIMTTAQCLLSRNRNPEFSREQIELKLKEYLGAERILWLNHGFQAGDDTDSHIDTLARFCDEETIAYVGCTDLNDEHFAELKAMEEELKSFRTKNGKPYNLVKLPMPSAIFDADGQRLPATYANFLILNNKVLVPLYNDSKDEVALELMRSCFSSREVVGIDCNSLILQHGSLHCVTMQFPEGVCF